MNLKEKKEHLSVIYRGFETESGEFRKQAVCRPGCAFCCTNMGNIDVTTLDGLVIRERMSGFSSKNKKGIQNRLLRNRQEKEKGNSMPCPFLKDDHTCLIYEIRPFSCRQLYSLEKCGPSGAIVHRQVKDMAEKTVKNCSSWMKTDIQVISASSCIFWTAWNSGNFTKAAGLIRPGSGISANPAGC